MLEDFSLVRRVSEIGPLLGTLFCGVRVGRDVLGNRYYRARFTPSGAREKRWVIYRGEPEASKVPPEWHIWLHHGAKEPLTNDNIYRQFWQKPHQPNPTGTENAYTPSCTAPKSVCKAWNPES